MDVLKKFAVLLLLLSSCTGSDKPADNPETAQVHIVTTNAPLFYFAQRLAPRHVQVRFPMADATDPAYWEVVADSVSVMQNATLVFMNGADYETWAPNVSLPASRIITTVAGDDSLIPVENTVTHSHGDEGEHSHEGTAFTTWMDFELAAAQASKMANALKEEFPESSTGIDERLSLLSSDLENLHRSMTEVTDTSGYYVFSHPVYQYFQRAYHINGESVHWEPDITLTSDQLHTLEHIKDHQSVTAVIWENTPSEINLQKLDSMGVRSIVVRPAGGWESGYDFIKIMESNIQNFNRP